MNETTVPPPVPQSKTSKLAVWCLVLGILSLACFSIFSAIPGVICGHKALSQINNSGGALSGRSLAIAGLTISYIGIALAVLCIILVVVAEVKGH